MSWSHVLVAVAPEPESRVLIEKAVSIVRPVEGRIRLLTLAPDPVPSCITISPHQCWAICVA